MGTVGTRGTFAQTSHCAAYNVLPKTKENPLHRRDCAAANPETRKKKEPKKRGPA